MRLILASRSPQRREILTRLGVPFEALAGGVAERDDGDPAAAVAANARAKAEAVAGRPACAGATVLGVDTVVVLDGRIRGKPRDAAHARATLAALAGRRHEVLSGVCVVDARGTRAALEATSVEFRPLGDAELEWYLATGEWRERAGGYAIQGAGGALVRRIEGDWLNVVGLPVATLLDLLPGLLGHTA